jgi:hypothetical protein
LCPLELVLYKVREGRRIGEDKKVEEGRREKKGEEGRRREKKGKEGKRREKKGKEGRRGVVPDSSLTRGR